jgi:peroxiredoxin
VRASALALVVGVVCASAGCGTSDGGQGPAPKTATTGAQDFTSRDVEGNTVRLSDHLGKKVILIDFWSTFCAPCLAEFPHLNRIYAANKDKGFVILAVSMDGPDTVANVPAYTKRNNLAFPVLLDEDSHIASLYNPKKTEPLSLLIDKNGNVVRVREGYNPGDEKLIEEDVNKLVAGQSL